MLKQICAYTLLLISWACHGESFLVTRIIDGDTFEIETGDKVRLIGINAPEISDIFGQEAKEYLSSLIHNRVVALKPDEFSKDRDIYQRLLRYVIVDGVDINKKMVKDGYAFAYLKYRFGESEEYKQAQIDARESHNGIWGNSKRDSIIQQQNQNETGFRLTFSTKAYFISSLVFVLVAIGIYSYFRK